RIPDVSLAIPTETLIARRTWTQTHHTPDPNTPYTGAKRTTRPAKRTTRPAEHATRPAEHATRRVDAPQGWGEGDMGRGWRAMGPPAPCTRTAPSFVVGL